MFFTSMESTNAGMETDESSLHQTPANNTLEILAPATITSVTTRTPAENHFTETGISIAGNEK